jgi:hypothetical protein
MAAHIEEAEFLSEQYLAGIANGTPIAEPDQVYLHDIANRLNANLDGLLLTPDISWKEIAPMLESGIASIFFVASAVAFGSGDVERIKQVVDQAVADSYCLEAVAFGMAWQPWGKTVFWAQKFIQSERFELAYIGLYCHLWHKQIQSTASVAIFERLFAKEPEAGFLTLVLRLVVQTKEISVVPVLRNLSVSKPIADELSEIQFLYLKARLLVGDTTALEALKPYVTLPWADQEDAVMLVFRHLDSTTAKHWLRDLQQAPGRDRLMLQAIAALREKELLPWVVNQMAKPELSRLAGYTVGCILGVDIEAQGWVLDDEALDEKWLEIEGDEMLPWPDTSTIKSALGIR